MMKNILAIGGFDPTNGAGIGSDIKTILLNDCYALSVVTAITFQNRSHYLGARYIEIKDLARQMEAIFCDFSIDAIKIGMVGDKNYFDIIKFYIDKYKIKYVVFDPVLKSSTLGLLHAGDDYLEGMKKFFSSCYLVTPNLKEASILVDKEIESIEGMKKWGIFLQEKYNTNFLLKGGHLKNQPVDILFIKNGVHEFWGERICSNNTHGTGCFLSSSIASLLAKGEGLVESIKKGKSMLEKILSTDIKGDIENSPIDHNFLLRSTYEN